MKNMFYKIGAWISVLPVLLLPTATYAGLTDAGTNLSQVGDAASLSQNERSLPKLIGGLINVIISVLGIVFVILIVYAGILYMTAGGEKDKVEKAKNLMIQAVIGLVIIVAAYAISSFVITQLTTITS
ncbi:pilin [Patescibacteria group bacterium]|nr:pilin [Patescibacteria group bacterium]